MALNKLRALQTLNVSGTEFNKHGLEIVVDDLPLLENLDISCTRVDDITPLMKCKDRLKSLTMYNLKVSACGNVIPVLLELNALRNLDISDERDSFPFEMFVPVRSKITDLLKATHCMPYLASLDISGRSKYHLQCFYSLNPCCRCCLYFLYIFFYYKACFYSKFLRVFHCQIKKKLYC